MNNEDLEFFRSRLLRERERILKAYGRKADREETGLDVADQAAESSEALLMSSLSNNDAQTLRRIERAMRRVDDGSYGVCESCGDDISLRRLRVLPYATRCVECENSS